MDLVKAHDHALAVTEAFIKTAGPVAAQLVGDIGQNKQDAAEREEKALRDMAQEANARGDTEAANAYAARAAQAKDLAAKWGDNGVYRLGLHLATQSLIGGAANGGAGAAGAEACFQRRGGKKFTRQPRAVSGAGFLFHAAGAHLVAAQIERRPRLQITGDLLRAHQPDQILGGGKGAAPGACGLP